MSKRAVAVAVAVASALAVVLTATAGTASASTANPLGWGKPKHPLELTASDGAPSDQFGSATAFSGNGKVAVVSAPGKNDGAGVAYVFTKTRKGWNQVAELTASDEVAGDAFGNAVALSRTGSTIAIGAVIHDNVAGSAYVFTRSGDSWAQTAELTPSDGGDMAFFGVAISISSDGSKVLVGAQQQNVDGAAYVFSDQGGSWTQTQELTASDGGAYDGFGGYVAFSGDGSTAVIGSPDHATSGAAYVFQDESGTWTQTDELTASDSGGSFIGFGNRFAVSRTGSLIAVGAVGLNNYTGATYVFTGSPGDYTQTAELTGNDSVPGDFFGSSVSMSHNGKILAVSADGQNVNTGAEYVFVRDAGTWSQKAELTAPDGGQYEYYGLSTAMPGDGSTLFVSSTYHNSSTGVVYAYNRR